MMTAWALFILELVVLFFSSKYIFQALFTLSYRIFRKESSASIPVFIIFLPGVIIHELAHYLTAEILLVKVHNLELSPKIIDGRLKMASVEMRQSDIVRQMLIGVAPIIAGLGILTASVYGIIHFFNVRDLLSTPNGFGIIALLIYLTFVISNTMFSSKKDVEGAFKFLLILFFLVSLVTLTAFLLKVDVVAIFSNIILSKTVIDFLNLVDFLLFPAVVIDVVFIFLANLLFKRHL